MSEVAPSRARPRVAMVIGSGSVKCAAALGVQRVLQRHDIDVDLYVGCSAGSVFATAMAMGWSAERTEEATARMWTRELTSRPRRGAMLQAIRPRMFGFSPQWGLRDPSPIVEAVRAAFGDTHFADTSTALRITATDFETGEQVVIDEGDVVPAIRASLSIPFVFPPLEHQGRTMIDGCLSDPLPVGVAIREGAQTIIAIGFEAAHQTRISSPARLAFQLSSVMTNNLLRSRFAFHNLAHHGEVIPIVPRFRERIGLFDTERFPSIIDQGEEAAEEQLPLILSSLAAEEPAP